MAERFIASVLKTEVAKVTVGSNPTLPAILERWLSGLKHSLAKGT
jgi:hypothetical protein